MLNKKYQRGQSMLRVVIYIILGGVTLTCILKLGPLYVTNMTVKNVLEGVKSDTSLAKLKNSKLRLRVRSRFASNSIRGVAQDSIDVSRDDGVIKITVNYEERIPFLYNVDAVVKFENQVEFEEQK